MSAQDLEQRARELLAQIRHLLSSLPVDCLGRDTDASGQPYPIRDEVIHGITKLLAQQPAPVDLEQFREAVEFYATQNGLLAYEAIDRGVHHSVVESYEMRERSGKRLLSIIDNAGKVESACEVRLCYSQWVNIVNAPEVLNASDREEAVSIAVRMTEEAIANNVAGSILPPARQQPAPVVDDAMVEAAWIALDPDDVPGLTRRKLRAALTAALARAQGVQS